MRKTLSANHYLIPKRQLEFLAARMHPSLNQPHRPQEEPAVLVAGLQLEFWRSVVVTVHPEWERAATDPWGPDCLDDAVYVAVREPANGI